MINILGKPQLNFFKTSGLLFLVLILASCSELDSTPKKLAANKVVVIGHLYPYLKANYLTKLKEQISQIEGLAAIVLAGDIVEKSNNKQYNLFNDFFAGYFDVPIYYIPGNHEMADEQVYLTMGSRFSKVGNNVFLQGNKRIIAYSSHIQNVKASIGKMGCEDTDLLERQIKENHVKSQMNYLILADMRCFKRKHWKKNIHPLIRAHIDFVVIGDNESTQYNYTWEEFEGVKYIYQGFTHRGHHLSGDNTFMILDDDKIKVEHFKVSDALDLNYKTRNKFKKLN